MAKCKYCGCTETSACEMPRHEGPCWWVNSDPPICSHDECQAYGRQDGHLPPAGGHQIQEVIDKIRETYQRMERR